MPEMELRGPPEGEGVSDVASCWLITRQARDTLIGEGKRPESGYSQVQR